jgi:two-component system LytT family response regulator
MKMRTVIADDDTLSVRSLMRLLKQYGEEIEVISIAQNGTDGLEMIDRLRPELTFVDVAMPMLDGFEMARRLTHKPVVVFMTTADGNPHEAEAAGGLALLFKPIGHDDIASLMNRVRAALKLPAVLQFRPKAD